MKSNANTNSATCMSKSNANMKLHLHFHVMWPINLDEIKLLEMNLITWIKRGIVA